MIFAAYALKGFRLWVGKDDALKVCRSLRICPVIMLLDCRSDDLKQIDIDPLRMSNRFVKNISPKSDDCSMYNGFQLVSTEI